MFSMGGRGREGSESEVISGVGVPNGYYYCQVDNVPSCCAY